MNEYWKTTVDLMESSKRVISAVDMVQTALTEGQSSDVQFTGDLLARTAYDYAGHTGHYERFSFEKMAAVAQATEAEQLTSNLLINILLDLKVANTLMVASQVTGETIGPATIDELETAICWLESLVERIALPLTWTAETPAAPVYFDFVEAPIVPPVHSTTDLAVAKANFQQQVDGMLTTLVAQTKDIVQAGWEAVKELDQEQVITAIGQISQMDPQVPRLGQLVNQSLNLTTHALRKLTHLLGLGSTELLQEESRQLSARLLDKNPVLDEFLAHTYRVAETKYYVVNLLRQSKTDLSHLIEGSKQLAALHHRFAEQMIIVNRILTALQTGQALAEFALPKATARTLFGVFYLVAMDYVVLAGMDFADSALLFNFVPGVISISETTFA
jgi:hypothetical protein